MSPEVGLVVAAATGLAIGNVLVRGEFCVVSALSQAILFRSYRALAGVAVTAAIVLLGTSAARQLGMEIEVGPIAVLPAVAGGLLFGAGMAVAGGCVSGTLYRVGSGYAHFWIVLAGMMGGLILVDELGPTAAGASGPGSVIDLLPDVPPILVGLIPVAIVLAVLIRRHRGRPISWLGRRRPGPAIRGLPLDPLPTGAALGILFLIQLALVAPIGFTHGIRGATEGLLTRTLQHRIELVLVTAVVAGSAIGAWRRGTLVLRRPNPKRVPGAAIGGLLMGVGGGTVGCNVGVLLGSAPALTVHGLVAGAAMVASFSAVTYGRQALLADRS